MQDPLRVDDLQGGGGGGADRFHHHVKCTFTRMFRAKENGTEVPIREGLVTALHRDGAPLQRVGRARSWGPVRAGHIARCHVKVPTGVRTHWPYWLPSLWGELAWSPPSQTSKSSSGRPLLSPLKRNAPPAPGTHPLPRPCLMVLHDSSAPDATLNASYILIPSAPTSSLSTPSQGQGLQGWVLIGFI